MEFTYNQRREKASAAQRSVAVGTRGMVSSSQHLATMAGLRILRKGGNAIDAAVAMAATLTVVEPHSVRHRRRYLCPHLPCKGTRS